MASQERVALALLGIRNQKVEEQANLPTLNEFSNEKYVADEYASAELDLSFIESGDSMFDFETLNSSPSIIEKQTVPDEISIEDASQASRNLNQAIKEEEPSDKIISIDSLLIEITADLTGYPLEMLQPSMALEADLGIDSIKRVEILGRLQKVVPAETLDLIAAKKDELADAKTIGEITSILTTPGK